MSRGQPRSSAMRSICFGGSDPDASGFGMIHQGQMEGKREKLPVQRVTPLTMSPGPAPPNRIQQLLRVTAQPSSATATWRLSHGYIWSDCFYEEKGERVIAYLGQISRRWHAFDTTAIDVSAIARAVGAGQHLHFQSTRADGNRLERTRRRVSRSTEATGNRKETRFCLLEGSSV